MAEKVTQDNAQALVQMYGDLLFRLSYLIVANEEDAQDAVQETFVRYLTKAPLFQSPEHEKAWLCKVVSNVSKNIVKFRRRHPVVDEQALRDVGIRDEDLELTAMILELPVRYKLVMNLYYVVGYKSDEIADMLDIPGATVRKRLQTGRRLLKEILERGDRE